jgi:outer membrane protein OmpA-like peptidoglycan-associated protein
MTFCLLLNTQAEAKGFWKAVGKLLGNVAETAVVVAVDRTVEKYAPEQAAQHQQTMQELNAQSQKRAEEDAAAWSEYTQGRKTELQKELAYTRDSETREYIRQQITELDGVSTSSATNYNTSLSGSMLSKVGIKQQNIQRGMDWNNAQNKYEKQNVVKDYVFDAAGGISGQSELIKKFRQISKAQNTYLSENSKAMTEEEKRVALDKRNQAYFDIGYDTYQEAQSRKSQYLADKLRISNKLMESGWYNDTQLANEVAGSIIAIQKSDLPEQEKEALLRGYGFSESAKQIQQLVNEVLNDNYASTDDAKRKAEEETERQAELARQESERKVAEERKNAIEKIAIAKIDGYAFDETALSDSQKSMLDDVAEILNKYPDVKVLLVGHTCEIGYKNINFKKGLKRAGAGKEYLVEKGIAQERISTDSKGETQPLVENTSGENRKQNRRIEFVTE